jgi:hypothetical protein
MGRASQDNTRQDKMDALFIVRNGDNTFHFTMDNFMALFTTACATILFGEIEYRDNDHEFVKRAKVYINLIKHANSIESDMMPKIAHRLHLEDRDFIVDFFKQMIEFVDAQDMMGKLFDDAPTMSNKQYLFSTKMLKTIHDFKLVA